MKPAEQSEWLARLVANLDEFGPDAAAAASFIRERGTRIGFHEQPTGARWTVRKHVELHPRYAGLEPDDPYAVSLVIHEVRHLQQGILTALSVYGELDAWKLQFGFLMSLTGRYHSDPPRAALIERLMALPSGWDRSSLETARAIMQAFAGSRYRIDVLPLYPLPAELRYRMSGRQPAK